MFWRIEVLGSFRVAACEASGLPAGTEARGFRSRKTAELLAYLALHRSRRHSRAELAERFWPEADELEARNSLSAALSSIRRELERSPVPAGAVLCGERDRLWLEQVGTDAAEFEAALSRAAAEADRTRSAAHLEAAVSLYRSPVLPGMEGDWIPSLSARLSDAFLGAADALATHLEQDHRLADALELVRRALAEDPFRSATRGTLMRLYVRDGRPHEALKQFHEFERLYWSEYRAAPPPELQAQARDIRQSMTVAPPPGEPCAGGPAHSAPSPETPAPARPTPAVPAAVPEDPAPLLERRVYRHLRAAIARGEGLVLLRGPRETGKTTLLTAALGESGREGARVVLTDMGAMMAARMRTTAEFLTFLAGELAERVDLDPTEAEAAVSPDGPARGFRRYLLRRVLDADQPSLVWAIDEFDRIFTQECCAEVLGLFRSWHNERAAESGGPWSRLSLVMAYSTEAHLHVRDLNQSPFNVGLTLDVGDLTPEQVCELNMLYGSPLREEEVGRLRGLVDGHPGLLNRSFAELSRGTLRLDDLERQGRQGGGIFAGHLQRLWGSLKRDPELCGVVADVLERRGCPRDDEFLRLRSAGVLSGAAPEEARVRCRLYEDYLRRRLEEHVGTGI